MTIFRDEDFDDCVNALKIARIMLPTPSARKKQKQEEAEAEEQEANEGDLVPADSELMKFSKVMGRASVPATEPNQEPDLE